MQSGIEGDDQESRSFIERARREQILRAAIETIAELGLAKASLARIAAHAGISTGLISYHFAGRDDLIAHVVRSVNDGMGRVLTERMEAAEDYQGALRGLITGFVRFCADNRAPMYALREIAVAARSEQSRGPSSSDREDLASGVAELLSEGQRDGEFRDFSVRVLALTLGAALEAVPQELYSRPDTDVDAYADELATIFVLAVRRPQPEETT
ncbi:MULTISPECIES: TetR/AcrR family transcriptional regulator [Actinoalloteichus]|uniref:Transcriptional regulator, TetR family n=1 Tax=Actinoalloteichus fjordicus TaxID=1612552 RepID=A0AAC9L9V4_9PSEU|nr:MULTISPECIES: TetR/AcrR family transcriptional regulator [Actinoalloteichus]APU14013.1 transcriptional regulator, TetR family [Actinoalloteichus fjordicus]APU19959.1 transcriptional regulator, TetR family [Actinoalloteichus sp. GBA129-24]